VNVERAREQLAAWNATAESGNDGDYDVWAEQARVSGWPEALDALEQAHAENEQERGQTDWAMRQLGAAEREASDLRERVAKLTEALREIAEGRWNVGTDRDRDLKVRQFARAALSTGEDTE
jgi:rubrerythrin